ncbi:MAG TPA: hypothetical protein VKR32_17910 [Puia sp.]|nr:hypothetical protein [Puia sp.]
MKGICFIQDANRYQIGKLEIISQAIGRVLLNLYNNGFYAANEKSKHQIHGYEPAVSVSTKKINGKVLLTVRDNGNGIPQKCLIKSSNLSLPLNQPGKKLD